MMTKSPKKKTLAEFKSLYDPNVCIPAAIRAGFASLLAAEGPEGWEYELDFMKRCDLNVTKLAQFRDQFEKHIVIVRPAGKTERRIWFGDVKIAEKARG